MSKEGANTWFGLLATEMFMVIAIALDTSSFLSLLRYRPLYSAKFRLKKLQIYK